MLRSERAPRSSLRAFESPRSAASRRSFSRICALKASIDSTPVGAGVERDDCEQAGASLATWASSCIHSGMLLGPCASMGASADVTDPEEAASDVDADDECNGTANVAASFVRRQVRPSSSTFLEPASDLLLPVRVREFVDVAGTKSAGLKPTLRRSEPASSS